jgi:hypothetical protein
MANQNDCLVCKYIRWYLLIGLPVLILVWTRPNLVVLEGLNLISIVSYLIGLGLIATIIWKYFNEYKK